MVATTDGVKSHYIRMKAFGGTDRAGIFAASLVFFLRVITRLVSIARLYAYIRHGRS